MNRYSFGDFLEWDFHLIFEGIIQLYLDLDRTCQDERQYLYDIIKKS